MESFRWAAIIAFLTAIPFAISFVFAQPLYSDKSISDEYGDYSYAYVSAVYLQGVAYFQVHHVNKWGSGQYYNPAENKYEPVPFNWVTTTNYPAEGGSASDGAYSRTEANFGFWPGAPIIPSRTLHAQAGLCQFQSYAYITYP